MPELQKVESPRPGLVEPQPSLAVPGPALVMLAVMLAVMRAPWAGLWVVQPSPAPLWPLALELVGVALEAVEVQLTQQAVLQAPLSLQLADKGCAHVFSA